MKRLFRLPIRRRDLTERDLDEEVRLHLELRTEELQRRGLSPEAARAEALRRFDPAGMHALRRAAQRRDGRLRLREWFSTLARDFRHALRTCVRRPFYTLGVSGTLALGIAAATVAFAVAWRVWLAPMPYPDPERVVRLYELEPAGPSSGAADRESRRQGFSPGLLGDFRTRPWRTMESVSGVGGAREIRWIRDGDTQRISSATISPEGLAILGVVPLLGRFPTAEAEVLLTEPFWRRGFGADPDVLGSTMRLGGRLAQVVGVARLPAGYPDRADVVDGTWARVRGGMGYDEGDRGFRTIEVIARLRSGHTAAEANAEADAFIAALAEIHPEYRGRGADVVVLADDLVRPFRDVIALLHAAGLTFLLLAAVNVMGLVAARRVEGRRDRSIRLALGASEGRLLRGSLIESLVLTLAGAASGILVAYWLIGPARALMPAGVPRLDQVAVTPALMAGALWVGAGLGVVIGVAGYLVSRGATPAVGGAPAWRAAGVGGRRALVIGQVALIALILSAGAAILHRLTTLEGVDLGFDPEGVSVTSTALDDEDRWGVVRGLLEGFEARGIPAAAALNEPLNDDDIPQMGMRRDAASEEISYEMHLASADYFTVMGVELLAGRLFEDDDPRSDRPEVVVSEEFVHRYFGPGISMQEAVGRLLAPLPYETTGPLVVGVVESARHHGPDAPVAPEVYVPLAHLTLGVVSLLVRGEPGEMAGAVAEITARVDPDLRWTPLIPYTSLLGKWFGPARVQLLTVTLLSGLGLLLASVGLYSFMAYQVVSGRRELGIRKALGAPDGKLVRDVFASSLAMVGVGTVIGLFAWYRLLPWTRQLVEGIDGAGSFVPLVVAAVVGSTCVLATLGPALRATRVDPSVTLKADG